MPVMTQRRPLLVSRRAALGAFAAALAAAPARAAPPLRVGEVGLSFYAATGGVVRAVFDRLGLPWTLEAAPHAEAYARLGAGALDVLVAAWLPNAHGPLHAPHAKQLVEAATLYKDALLYWAAPAHVPPDEVASVADLARPDIAARMDRDIVGVGPGSGLMRGSEEIMRRYGLAAAGYRLSVAAPDVWAGRLAEAARDGAWRVVPLWRPHHLNAVHAVRPLAEPLGVFAPDRCALVFRRAAWEALPDRARKVIGRVSLGIPAVTELDRRVVVDGATPEAAAASWMAEEAQRVDAWFAA